MACVGLIIKTYKMKSILSKIFFQSSEIDIDKAVNEIKHDLLLKLETELNTLCEQKAQINSQNELTNTGLFWLVSGKIEQTKKCIEIINKTI